MAHSGTPLAKASGLLILLHGRGASADDILSLWPYFSQPGLACVAPEAAAGAWYPQSFLAPVDQNEPWLSSALRKVETMVRLGTEAGLATERIAICGFSQGACLATEFVATHPARYAGLIAFTGGLIGPLDASMDHIGDLRQTPVFLGAGDKDQHVPWVRVQQSAEVLTRMNGDVTLRGYPGKPHSVSPDEITVAQKMIQKAFSGAFSSAARPSGLSS